MNELKKLTVLLVEDDRVQRCEMAALLEIYCGRVLQAPNGHEALALLDVQHPDLVISDIRMPVMDGLELAAQMKKCAPDTPVIFCTAFTETGYMLKAIEMGAAGFVRKPVDVDAMMALITKVAMPELQRRRIRELSEELIASLNMQMGGSPVQRAVAEQAALVAGTSFNVLLKGETGSGKSRLASIIHKLSPRREKHFVTIPLGIIPMHLAESEMFGHLKGAFTGADRNKTGLVETAHEGTLFLDDIDACPLELQAKLLRFVEEKKFMPLGSTTEKRIDVRVISASSSDLKKEIAAGRFRADVYYRLADVTITLPPLREISDAVVPLALKFILETCDEIGHALVSLDDEAVSLLMGMQWPGNIRQLKSVIRRAVLTSGSIIGVADIDAREDLAAVVTSLADENGTFAPPPFPCSLDKLERWSLEKALQYCGGKRMKTALMLGINYYTFRRRLAKYGITVNEE